MSVGGDERRIDEKGRITLPQSIRERFDLDAGERVRITVEEGRVVVQPDFADRIHRVDGGRTQRSNQA